MTVVTTVVTLVFEVAAKLVARTDDQTAHMWVAYSVVYSAYGKVAVTVVLKVAKTGE
jgi:hypothetical protein